MQGRMAGENECADANEHDECRQDYAAFVGGEEWLPMHIFRDTALGHKDGIVVALSEDEGRKDDVDNVKLDAQNSQDAQNPYPADCHRNEGNDGQLDSTEGKPQEEEHYLLQN